MTNNKFKKTLVAILSILLFSALLATINAEQEQNSDGEFLEGQHYHRISPSVATNVQDGSVEVLELFWYGCPHCFEFEKYLKSWGQDKPDYVEFMRMPAVLNKSWIPHARAYYALETMGEVERIHPIFFEAIHVQGRRLRDVESMGRFLSQHGIDTDEFEKAYNSFYVETKIKRSSQLVRDYGSRAVPTIIVNGKYRITASSAGGYEQVLKLMSQLVKQEENSS